MRVTVTVPAYLEKHFMQLSDELGLSKQDTLLHCLTDSVTGMKQPSVPTAQMPVGEDGDIPDLYMLAQPERLRVYTFSTDGQCLRGEEIGEFHELTRGERFSWVKFSRLSKADAEGWEKGKNGKLCEPCFEIARAQYNEGNKFF